MQGKLSSKKVDKAERVNILSIDGGGIRVLIPLIVLMELEMKTGRNISSMFQMYGGTSFGAIIAAALNKPKAFARAGTPDYTTLGVFNFLTENAKKIFEARNYVYGQAKHGKEHLGSKLGSLLGGAKMNRLINTVCIPAFDKLAGETVWFENDMAEEDADWKVADVVLASCCAPTFFDS